MWKLSKASLVAPILAVFVIFAYATVNVADTGSAPEEGAVSLAPAATLTSGSAEVRTPQQVAAAEAEAARAPLPPAVEVPFRPTISLSEYKAAKAKAAAATGEARPDGPGRGEAPELLGAPTIIVRNLEGVNQTTAGGLRPPDTHGAIGANHFVEITNSHLDVYTRAGTLVKSVTLASFFGYTLKTIFDPRCVYDSTWNRWVMSAEAFAETSTIQRQFLAISLTNDPTGAFFVYRIDVNTNNNNDFWDYPQLGMDQDAVIVTANIFAGSTGPYRTTRMFAVAKARLYNGLGFSVPLHTGLVATLAPPIVLDQNNNAFLIAANTSPFVRKYTLSNASNPAQQTLTSVNIPVAAYSIPPDARQPGTTNKLDTLDRRFVNASTQNGTALWNVHTITASGVPTPRFYQFNTTTNTVTRTGLFFESTTSDDWNASIAANTTSDVFVTWSSTKVGTGAHQARVRFSGRRSTDAGGITAGSALFTSATFYNPSSSTVERWGDYSAVTIDPRNRLSAWIVNEKINSATVWGTRIGQIRY